MATLTGSTIADSYDQLLAMPAGGGNGATLVALTDGNAANTFALEVSTAGIKSTGTAEVTGITTATGGVVGDLTGNVAGDLTGNVTATSVLADGVVGTTQSSGDNSTKVATTAYVDAEVATSDTLAEVLALGNTTGSTNIIVTAGQSITTDTVSETTSAAGVTIDSVLVKDNTVTATTFTGALTGNVTGNVTGDVTGDLTGDVTGDLTGNADTVTTNANLTGGVTSVGNAATVITNANLTGGVTSVGNAATVITNANLTGEVTSVGNAATIADDVVDEANLKVSNAPTNGYVLSAQSGDTGGLTWVEESGGNLTTKGDLEVYTTGQTRLGVGANNYVLTADTTAASGVAWKEAQGGTTAYYVQRFNGDTATVAFTLAQTPASENNTQVYISGVYQQKDTYAVSGTTLTFSSAPSTGTGNIEVVTAPTAAIGTTSSDLVTFSPTGTGAENRTTQSKLRDVVNVADFGAVGDGDGAGAGTDDSTDIQEALTYIVANGGVLEFDGTKTYRVDTALTAQIAASDVKETRWEIIGNGATLDCSNLTGAAVGLTIGGEDDELGVGGIDTHTYLNEKGYYAISSLRILGPEAVTPIHESSAATTVVGLFIYNAIRVNLTDVECTRCYTGIKTAFTFPLVATNCNVENNFIGLHLDDVSNLQKWNQLSAKQCWYSVLILKSGTYSSAKISGVNFEGLWIESSKVGVHIDTGNDADNRINSLRFANGFYKSITYDVFRVGIEWTFATPQTRGGDIAGKIFNVEIEGGNFPGSPATATAGAFVFSPSPNCFGFFGHATVDVEDAYAWVNEPSMGEFLFAGDEGVGTVTDFKKRYWENDVQTEPVLVPAPAQGVTAAAAYVEADWTPAVTFATAGDLSIAYNFTYGTYTKIGRLVTVQFDLRTSTFTHTTASGNLRINNLPYQPRAISGQTYRPVGVLSFYGIDKSGTPDFAHINCVGTAGSDIMHFVATSGAGGGLSAVSAADCPSGGDFRLHGTMTYETDE